MRDKAGAAAGVAKDKIDEVKPKVNEAVNDAKETGRLFEPVKKISNMCDAVYSYKEIYSHV